MPKPTPPTPPRPPGSPDPHQMPRPAAPFPVRSRPVIVCAPDSFKGSLSSPDAAAAMGRGIEAARAEPRLLPLADGGEGTVEAIVAAADGVFLETDVIGPLGEPRRARWGLIDDGATAVIEMAAAAGLPLVPPALRNPLHTTTHGVGQLIAAALDLPGVRRILIGVGGSATCDGGIGMAAALGARFQLEPNEKTHLADSTRAPAAAKATAAFKATAVNPVNPLTPVNPPFLTGGDLNRLVSIDLSQIDPRLRAREIEVLCDVTNPLLGPLGAAAVFGPQKGASPADVARLEEGLTRLADLWRGADLAAGPAAVLGTGPADLAQTPGAGASGGLAAGLVAFCGARIVPGIERILNAVDFDRAIAGADLVLTGEGAFNRQSLAGKVVSGVARRCRAAGLPLAVLAGSVSDEPDAEALAQLGIAGLFSIVDGPMTETEAMDRAAALLERRAAWIARLFLARRHDSFR